jgi:proline-specific peptidase
MKIEEGHIPFRQYRTWYRIVGDCSKSEKVPLLCLHGGPGATHDYLEPLEAIANSGRCVIFYDQVGCGNSDQPHDPSLWTVNLFVEELVAIRRALGLDRVHILGQSWGGMLAMEYALTRPSGLVSLVVASAPASMRQWAAETARLRSKLPAAVRRTLDEHENNGTTGDPAYFEAMMVFYKRHVCRLDPWPDCLNRSLEKLMGNPEVYETMNGPSEFHVTGNLRDWNIVGQLGEIRVPTLVTSGRYDEATPAIAQTVCRGIPGARWALFENSGHEAHIEETARYLAVLEEFLDNRG